MLIITRKKAYQKDKDTCSLVVALDQEAIYRASLRRASLSVFSFL